MFVLFVIFFYILGNVDYSVCYVNIIVRSWGWGRDFILYIYVDFDLYVSILGFGF